MDLRRISTLESVLLWCVCEYNCNDDGRRLIDQKQQQQQRSPSIRKLLRLFGLPGLFYFSIHRYVSRKVHMTWFLLCDIIRCAPVCGRFAEHRLASLSAVRASLTNGRDLQLGHNLSGKLIRRIIWLQRNGRELESLYRPCFIHRKTCLPKQEIGYLYSINNRKKYRMTFDNQRIE